MRLVLVLACTVLVAPVASALLTGADAGAASLFVGHGPMTYVRDGHTDFSGTGVARVDRDEGGWDFIVHAPAAHGVLPGSGGFTGAVGFFRGDLQGSPESGFSQSGVDVVAPTSSSAGGTIVWTFQVDPLGDATAFRYAYEWTNDHGGEGSARFEGVLDFSAP